VPSSDLIFEKTPMQPEKVKTKRNSRDSTKGDEPASEALGSEPSLPPDFSSDCDSASAVVRVVRLGQGLHLLEIGEALAPRRQIPGLMLPAIQVSAAPNGGNPPVEMLGAPDRGEVWLGRDGGVIVVRSPPDGGHVLVTAFGPPDEAAILPHVDIRRLDRRPSADKDAGTITVDGEADKIPTEIVLHVERLGDQNFPGRGWAGNRGRKLRVEAFSIRPTETLAARDIEFKALGPNGRQTPWVTDAKLCGTRGQGLPLTGFAIRLAPQIAGQFDVVYYGAFFDSGIAGPHRNGELCVPQIANDPLEAINVRLIRRADEPVIAGQGSVTTAPKARSARSRGSEATPSS
jgi:hypothetical protein